MMSSTSAQPRARAHTHYDAASAWNYGKNSPTDQSKEHRSLLTARPQKVLHGCSAFRSTRGERERGMEEQCSYYPKRSRATELRPMDIAALSVNKPLKMQFKFEWTWLGTLWRTPVGRIR